MDGIYGGECSYSHRRLSRKRREQSGQSGDDSEGKSFEGEGERAYCRMNSMSFVAGINGRISQHLRTRAICAEKDEFQNNGVSKPSRQARMAELNSELLQDANKQQEILRYMSIRDRLEYIDSKGNMTRTFYTAAFLTVFIYGCLIVGGFNLVVGIITYVNRITHGGF